MKLVFAMLGLWLVVNILAGNAFLLVAWCLSVLFGTT